MQTATVSHEPILASSNLTQLSVVKLNCCIELQQQTSLPLYLGSTLHGGFGHALMQLDPALYDHLFEPKDVRGNNLVKPFSFAVQPLETGELSAGSKINFILSLYGNRCEQLADAIAALFSWQSMGLGSQRTPFGIHRLSSVSPWGFEQVIYNTASGFSAGLPAINSLSEVLQSHERIINYAQTQQHVEIEALSRIRLKSNNAVQKHAPSPRLLVGTIHRRLNELTSTFTDNFTVNDILLPDSKDIALSVDASEFDDMHRYSIKEGRQQHIGGLLGSWIYSGNISTLMPWLLVGQWIGLGAKTTFGFGTYQWRFIQQ